MKTRYFSAIIAMCVSVGAFSQADDLYFVPTKKGKEVKQEKNIVIKERTVTVTNDDRDVDEYNRRVSYDDSYDNDTLYLDEGYDVTTDNYESDEEYAYSRRLLRFHSPTVGVYVSRVVGRLCSKVAKLYIIPLGGGIPYIGILGIGTVLTMQVDGIPQGGRSIGIRLGTIRGGIVLPIGAGIMDRIGVGIDRITDLLTITVRV